jgi:hypothetical protein
VTGGVHFDYGSQRGEHYMTIQHSLMRISCWNTSLRHRRRALIRLTSYQRVLGYYQGIRHRRPSVLTLVKLALGYVPPKCVCNAYAMAVRHTHLNYPFKKTLRLYPAKRAVQLSGRLEGLLLKLRKAPRERRADDSSSRIKDKNTSSHPLSLL